MFDSFPWGVVTIGGPIMLGLILAYSMFRYRKRDRRLDAQTERATTELYKQTERDAPDGGEPRPR